jgi:hypothetical protein
MYHRSVVNLDNITNAAFVDSNGTKGSTTSPIASGAGDLLNINLHYMQAAGVLLRQMSRSGWCSIVPSGDAD